MKNKAELTEHLIGIYNERSDPDGGWEQSVQFATETVNEMEPDEIADFINAINDNCNIIFNPDYYCFEIDDSGIE